MGMLRRAAKSVGQWNGVDPEAMEFQQKHLRVLAPNESLPAQPGNSPVGVLPAQPGYSPVGARQP
jgi:hypothetical protein